MEQKEKDDQNYKVYKILHKTQQRMLEQLYDDYSCVTVMTLF